MLSQVVSLDYNTKNVFEDLQFLLIKARTEAFVIKEKKYLLAKELIK